MRPTLVSLFLLLFLHRSHAQLALARDTIMVVENGYVLKMPWGNGINYANVSSADLNLDGKRDLVVFDRCNLYGEGRFRCFINTGLNGQLMYRSDTWMSYRFPRCFNWALFADYNNDGKEDLFCAGNNVVSVYKNVSTPANTPAFALIKSTLITNITPSASPSYWPLYVSTIGVPGIADVDNDGDLDILTFSSSGTYVQLQRNVCVEKNLPPDSLAYEYADPCWGDVAESNCTVDFDLCNGSSFLATLSGGHGHKELHAGSCLTCIDSDGDLDKDLLIGDVGCNNVQYVHNNGTPTLAAFNDTTKIYPNYKNNNTTPIRINSFPCAYHVDVDGDGRKDLLASPNSTGNENFKSLWYYRNTGSTPVVNFQFVKNNFLQDEMIEVGQNSFPVLFDYNGDGKKDLLIGTHGYYISNTLSPRLTLYKNTGTLAQPAYSLVSRDYANLGAQSGLSGAVPTVGDLDDDGDLDLCIGTTNGQIHWLENTAGAGNVCNFSVFKNNPFQFSTNSAMASPQLFDLNEDGKLDLLIGTKNGRIAYYMNIGTKSAPAFSLITNSLGNINVTDNPLLFGSDGYAAPFFYKESGAIKLLVGSVSGRIFQYTVPSDILAAYNLVSSWVNGFYEGGQSSVCYEDVNNDNKRDLFVGNASGGLCFFNSLSPYVGIYPGDEKKMDEAITVFPNPSTGVLRIKIDGVEYEDGKAELYDLPGKKLAEKALVFNDSVIDLSTLESGIYFVKITLTVHNNQQLITRKIVKQ